MILFGILFMGDFDPTLKEGDIYKKLLLLDGFKGIRRKDSSCV